MSILKARYLEVLDHLRRAYRAMQLPLDVVDDDVGVLLMKEQFKELVYDVKKFARDKHGFARVKGGSVGRRREETRREDL